MNHIIATHPDLIGLEALVQAVVENLEFVRFDANYPVNGRESFYTAIARRSLSEGLHRFWRAYKSGSDRYGSPIDPVQERRGAQMAMKVAPLEFDPRTLTIPEATMLPRSALRWSYNQFADTLYVHFFGKALPAVSVPVETGDHDVLYLRVEPETHRVTGLQIEDVSSFAQSALPGLDTVVTEIDHESPDREQAMHQLLDEVRRLIAASNPESPASEVSA